MFPIKRKKKTNKRTRKDSRIRPSAKTVVKTKKRRRKINKKSDMDAVFKVINQVQLQRKQSKFTIDIKEIATVENILKDLEIEYNTVSTKTQTTFFIKPPPVKEESTIFDIDYLDDEIIEEGQIF